VAADLEGNISGISRQLLMELEALGRYVGSKSSVIDPELALPLAMISSKLNREVAVYLNRQGRVVYLAVGKDRTAPLAHMGRRKGLAGLRCIHTHPGGNGRLSSVDYSALYDLSLDCMVALGVDKEGNITNIGLAWGSEEKQNSCILLPGLNTLEKIDFLKEIREIEKNFAVAEELADSQEKAILVALSHGESAEDVERSLAELARLAETAGLKVLSSTFQNRNIPSASTYIGRGKAEELSLAAQALDADVIIFDDEISPAAQKNLENIIGKKVIDRTLLILDIFAQRARSNEGKLQVELAQLRYSLPRLMGQGQALSRLGGGIGTRGPGETQLETDRRKIRRRITELEARQNKVMKTRELHRSNRRAENLPLIALVGYTNAGKSTLLNTLSGADAMAEDILFATLDAMTRRVVLPDGRPVLITDTVGFIRRLPHHLITAFRSTLEEVREADVLLHIVDGSAPDAAKQAESVMRVLAELDVLEKPILTVINKVDEIPDTDGVNEIISAAGAREAVFVSAKKQIGMQELLRKIPELLPGKYQEVTISLSYDQGNWLSLIHEQAKVLTENYTENGIELKIRTDDLFAARLKQGGLL